MNEVGQKIINLAAGDNFNVGSVLLNTSNRMIERYNILCDTSGGGGAINIQFPTYAAIQNINNFEVTITDTGNNAAVNNINILPGSGNTANQSASVAIATNKGAAIVVMNGTNDWSVFKTYDAAVGAGTVTSFSSGNLSPIFTTGVANATTTPALSFTLTVQEAHFVFIGPNGGSPAAPTFRALVGDDLPLSVVTSGPYALDTATAIDVIINATTYHLGTVLP